jgi:inorganic pyrophosphatase
MNLWHDIDPGTAEGINVIIEIPSGSSNKYELDKETGLMRLDRVNYSPTPYPTNYGFIPQTLWDDGDALDVLVPATFPFSPSILLEARPVALMTMTDGGESDDKIIAVPIKDNRWNDVRDLEDLNQHSLKEIKLFFETIKRLKGKPVEVIVHEFKNAAAAKKAFAHSRKLYQEKFGKK